MAEELYKISPVFGGGTPVTVKTATLAGTLSGAGYCDQLHGVVLMDLQRRGRFTP